MSKVKELWENKKWIFGILLVFLILIVVVIFFFLAKVFHKYQYSEMEDLLVSSSQKYLRAHSELTPNASNPFLNISLSELTQNKYLKNWDKMKPNEGCTGEVHVLYQNEKIRYTPLLNCNSYQTKTIKDYILDNESIKTSEENESGLYYMNGPYVYRGEFVNNYLSFANFLWRIVKIDDTKIYLVLADTINGKANYVYDDRYNDSIQGNRGHNRFENSRARDSLENIFQNDFQDYHAYMDPFDACISARAETETDKTGNVDCQNTVESHFALLSVADYINASLDPNCSYSVDRNCSNYNYLANTKNRYWLLNGNLENTYEVYYVDPLGKVNVDSANAKKDLRPFFAISTQIIYGSGNGTKDHPYLLRLFK